MTNAEKYKEIFGMIVDPEMCPTKACDDCPAGRMDKSGDVSCVGSCTYNWWNQEYKEVTHDNG